MNTLPKYLARPDDGEVWSLNEDGSTYSSKRFKDEHPDNITHEYAYETLLACAFYEVTGEDFPALEEKGKDFYEFLSWQGRSDGHGGSKGGTREEFLEYKKKGSNGQNNGIR
jgi:hypothetical protein